MRDTGPAVPGASRPRAAAALLPNWLGDVVMAAPAARCLARRLAPGLDLYVRDAFAPLVEILVPGVRVTGFRLRSRAPGRLADRLALARAMRRRRRGTVCLLTGSLSTALVARASGARERVGTPTHGRGWLLTRQVARCGPSEHEADAYLRIARAAAEASGGEAEPVPSEEASAGPRSVALSPRVLRSGREALERAGVDPEATGVLALAPGAAYGPAKQWGAGRFAELARRASEGGLAPVVVGSAAERSLAREVARLAAPAHVADLTGRTGLVELAGVLALARGLAGNDSGVAHLAAALGTATAAVFLSTDHVRTAPRGAVVRVLLSPVPCRPCRRRECPRGTYECREAVGVSEVMEALRELGAFGAG